MLDWTTDHFYFVLLFLSLFGSKNVLLNKHLQWCTIIHHVGSCFRYVFVEVSFCGSVFSSQIFLQNTQVKLEDADNLAEANRGQLANQQGMGPCVPYEMIRANGEEKHQYLVRLVGWIFVVVWSKFVVEPLGTRMNHWIKKMAGWKWMQPFWGRFTSQPSLFEVTAYKAAHEKDEKDPKKLKTEGPPFMLKDLGIQLV